MSGRQTNCQTTFWLLISGILLSRRLATAGKMGRDAMWGRGCRVVSSSSLGESAPLLCGALRLAPGEIPPM